MQVPEGYIAFVEELPGANTQGATLEEARENLREAVALVLEANRELAELRQLGSNGELPPSEVERLSDLTQKELAQLEETIGLRRARVPGDMPPLARAVS